MSSSAQRIVGAACGLAAIALAASARGQACCAGGGVVTPGRLAPHEVALVGIEARAGWAIGSHDGQARYAGAAQGSAEVDLEQALLASVRLHKIAQISLRAPLAQTWRTTRSTGGEFGGGLGDLNASARVDLLRTGQARPLPGVAILAGITLPTGKATEDASKPLATDATGIGAWQGSVGVAAEQTFGPWLVSVSAVASLRSARHVGSVSEALAPQIALVGAAGYDFENEATVAAVLSFATEANASINGAEAPSTSHRQTRAGLSGVLPFSDRLRLQGSVFVDLPIDGLGRNATATTGMSLVLLRTFT
jgi:hypothetical protein